MLSRIRAWLKGEDGDGSTADAGTDGGNEKRGGDADGGAVKVDRTRPLTPLRREEFVAGGGFVVRDGDRPGKGVPGEDLNRLHQAASERFDLDSVPENHKVADVALAADGTVLDVEWYETPAPVAARFRE
jgi:hypothetical protein